MLILYFLQEFIECLLSGLEAWDKNAKHDQGLCISEVAFTG